MRLQSFTFSCMVVVHSTVLAPQLRMPSPHTFCVRGALLGGALLGGALLGRTNLRNADDEKGGTPPTQMPDRLDTHHRYSYRLIVKSQTVFYIEILAASSGLVKYKFYASIDFVFEQL